MDHIFSIPTFQSLILVAHNNIDPEAFNQIMTNIGKEFHDVVIFFTTHKGELLSFEANKISIREVNL